MHPLGEWLHAAELELGDYLRLVDHGFLRRAPHPPGLRSPSRRSPSGCWQLARARREESRLAWALVRCALYGYCDNRVVEEHGDLLDALGELQASFPDKPAEWFYRAAYRLLAGKVEKVGASTGSSRGYPRWATPTRGTMSG